MSGVKKELLTGAQLEALRLMAMGIPYKEIYSKLGVDRTTVYRWRRLPKFAEELSRLVEVATEESTEKVIRDISEIQDVVLDTLLDVAQHDASGGARVAAAKVLTEMMEKAEERAGRSDVMADQTEEIAGLLRIIHQEQVGPPN